MKNLKMRNRKGITLIALVITIIVLLILAGVTISMLSGNDGIISQAGEAKTNTEEKLTLEQVQLAASDALLRGEDYTSIEDKEDLSDALTSLGLTPDEEILGNSTDGYKVTIKGILYNVASNGAVTGPSEIDKLQEKYEFGYYNSLNSVITEINNSSIGDNTIESKQDAVAGVYTDNDNIYLVLLKDATLNEEITPTVDMSINLGGKTLTFNSDNGLNITSGNVTIDGTIDGSKISLTKDNQKTTLAQVNNGSLTLNGGTYETISNGIGTDADPNGSIVVGSTGTLTVADAKIISNDTDGGTIAGILVEEGGSVAISDSDIEVTSPDGLKSDGIRNFGTMTLTNTNVVGYANYTANAQKTDYATSTRGINNEGTMTLKNCKVYGAHSGIRSTGTLYIDGGTYEGYGHGGIYFAGADTTSYVKNAYLGICEMRNGYDDGIAGNNKAGFYIGGASNITVYMDNCELWGTFYPLVMRISSAENNNSLYISNTTLKEGFERYIRIGTDKNIKIYIGSGNNFTAEQVYYDSNAEETNTDYSTQFPEY